MANFIDISISGEDAIIAGLQKTLDATVPMQRVMQPLGQDWTQTLIDETPIGRGSNPGKTRKAYKMRERYGAASASVRITNTVPWLAYLLNGRGPVSAKNARALRFEIDGTVYFRRSVGPAKPNDIPGRAERRMASQVNAAAQQVAEAIVAESGL